ncbi:MULTISPECIES: hypothetical protein [unclassified Pseudomonas]|uniref:hypothetical protein n=1 Tax=unclassified Pseudomonas TaxID=196821 RepID=UPI00249CE939|nr:MULTISPECIES: hypothetical protein [unclassified Pseudomonas]
MSTMEDVFSKISKIDILKMSDAEALNLLISISSLGIAALSLAIALIVLFYAAYQFLLKRGSKFYGTFSISRSVWSNQSYVGEVIIENTKDKAATISTIYLRIGRNIYLELVDYSNSPRIVAPFETLKIGFHEGVSGYISSTFKVTIDSMLTDHKVRKTLVIATPQGISIVKRYKTIWNIYIESLKNYFIIPVHPVKKYHKEKYYSDALQYIVSITDNVGTPEEHRLYRDATYTIMGNKITTNDFSSTDELRSALATSKAASCTITVERAGYDYNDYDSYEEAAISHHGLFKTFVIGTIFTRFQSLALHLKNKANKKK